MPFLYFFLVIISLFFYILYEPAFSFYLFAFLLLMPVVLFVLTLYTARHLKISFVNDKNTAGRSLKVPLGIRIENSCRFPAANLVIELEYYNTVDRKKSRLKINTPVYPNEVHELTLNVSGEHYGVFKMKIKRCKIYDILKLSRFRVIKGYDDDGFEECSMIIVPDHIPIENNIACYTDMGLETDEYSKHSKGDDPSEIFDIHEYIDGDKISRIHWKLSAKQNKTMVKDYSMPITNSIMIMLDLNFNKNDEGFADLYDTVIESATAISYYLVMNETPHRVIWYDARTSRLINMNVSDDETYGLLVNNLLQARLYNEYDLGLMHYVSEDKKYKCGHLMYLTTRYSENATELMGDADLAYKYTCLLVSKDETRREAIYDEIAQIVPVYPFKVAECIQDICF